MTINKWFHFITFESLMTKSSFGHAFQRHELMLFLQYTKCGPALASAVSVHSYSILSLQFSHMENTFIYIYVREFLSDTLRGEPKKSMNFLSFLPNWSCHIWWCIDQRLFILDSGRKPEGVPLPQGKYQLFGMPVCSICF